MFNIVVRIESYIIGGHGGSGPLKNQPSIANRDGGGGPLMSYSMSAYAIEKILGYSRANGALGKLDLPPVNSEDGVINAELWPG